MKKESPAKTTPSKGQPKRNKTATQPAGKNSFQFFAGIVVVVILGLFIYSNSFDCSFQFDDKHNIIDNPAIRSLSDIKPMWDLNHSRFIAFYSFAINYHFNKLDVWGYHFMNLIIHLINSCLVYWIILSLFRSPFLKSSAAARHANSIALVTALLFVSHPLATGAVTYIVQRMASLVALFYFASVLLFIQGRLAEGSRRYRFFAGSFVAAILGMLTKENAYTIPFALLMIELFFFNTSKLKIDFKNYKTLLALGGMVGFMVFTISTFSFSVLNPIAPSIYNMQEITPANYFFTQLSVLVKYLQLLILPIGQNIDHDFPISQSLFELRTLLSGLFLAGLLVTGALLYNRNRIISFGIFWFFLTIALESSFIPISDVIFEHRTYIPSFGLFFIASTSAFLFLWNKSKNLTVLLTVFVLLSNSVLAYQRNKVWKNEITLWSDAISKSPNKARVYINRGYAYGNMQQWNKAIADFSKANEINPNHHGAAYYNLGYAYFSLGQLPASIEHLSKAVELDSLAVDAYYVRGVAYYYQKETEKALKDYSKAIAINPRYDKAYFSRGILYANMQRMEDAINDYTKALEINPGNADVYYNRGIQYGNLNKWDKAVDDLSKAIELNPNNRNAYSNLNYAKSKLKNPAQ